MLAHFSLEILQPDNNEMAHVKHWKENIVDLESYIQKKICFEIGGKIYSQKKIWENSWIVDLHIKPKENIRPKCRSARNEECQIYTWAKINDFSQFL